MEKFFEIRFHPQSPRFYAGQDPANANPAFGMAQLGAALPKSPRQGADGIEDPEIIHPIASHRSPFCPVSMQRKDEDVLRGKKQRIRQSQYRTHPPSTRMCRKHSSERQEMSDSSYTPINASQNDIRIPRGGRTGRRKRVGCGVGSLPSRESWQRLCAPGPVPVQPRGRAPAGTARGGAGSTSVCGSVVDKAHCRTRGEVTSCKRRSQECIRHFWALR